MPLTAAQDHVILEWLDKQKPLPELCPVCGSDKGYDYDEVIAACQVDPYGKVQTDTFSEPMLRFECQCGYVLLFVAKRIPGLL